MRKHIGWYMKGLKGAAAFRAKMNHAEKPEEVFDLIRSFFEKAESSGYERRTVHEQNN
jgi:tRNA-dihydrouridine synthase B